MKRWPTIPLEEIAEVYGGSTPSRNNPAFWNGNIPWVTPTDLPMPGEGISVVSKTNDCITQAGLDNSSAILVPKGTVLFSSRATIGKVAVAGMPLTTNQGFANFFPHSNVKSRFLAYALWFHREDIARLSGSTTFKEVNRRTLRKYRLPVPSLTEQDRIVKLLDEADELRKLRLQADRRTTALIPALFHEMFGFPFAQSLPYPVKKLGELVRAGDKINYGVVQPGDEVPDGIPIVRAGDFNGMSIDQQHLKRISPEIEVGYKRSRIRGDEILISCVGSIGYVALADPSLAGFNIVRAVARIPLRDETDRVFVANQLMTPELQNFFRQETRTVAQPTLNIRQIEEAPIILPPLALQKEFARRVIEIRILETEQAASRRGLNNLFQSMLHGAFNGGL